jgi:hypothetical protein
MSDIRRRAIVLVLASAMLVYGTRLAAVVAPQDKPAPAPATAQTSEQQDMTALSQAVDAVAAGRPATDAFVTWLGNHFIRSQGDSIYIPFSVNIDKAALPSPTAAIYVRAVNRQPAAAGAPRYAWESTHFVDVPSPGQVSRAIALTPGTYDLFVAVKEKGAGAPAARVGVLRQELTVPPFSADLSTSSIILARALEQLPAPLPPEKQQDNPYVFGPLRVVPVPDSTFAKNADLQVLFWIYGASQTAGKPDVQVEFSFHQRLPEGEKYFNRTNPQELNAKTLPAEFNLTAGHQLLSSLLIPLTSFPPGLYRLEIKVTDKPSGRSLTNNVNFTVAAA